MVIRNRLKYTNYYLIIIFGAIMAFGVFAKLVFILNIDSDWFWFLAGVGIRAERLISYRNKNYLIRSIR